MTLICVVRISEEDTRNSSLVIIVVRKPMSMASIVMNNDIANSDHWTSRGP